MLMQAVSCKSAAKSTFQAYQNVDVHKTPDVLPVKLVIIYCDLWKFSEIYFSSPTQTLHIKVSNLAV